VEGFSSLELGSHVSSTVNSCKRESDVVIRLKVASNLAIQIVGSPVLTYIPVKTVDPILCAESWYCAVDVSGVV
jgi:hypothetical protein